MARKRLSDLLREEAKKASESEPQDGQEPDASATPGESSEKTPQPQQPTPKSTAQSKVKSTASNDSASQTTVDTEAVALPEEASAPAVELEAMIAELKTALSTTRQTAEQQEAALKADIANLKQELQNKQKQIDQFHSEVQQIQYLKTELEDARKMILQLSQVNAQPAPPTPSPPSTRVAEPELESSPNVAQTAKPLPVKARGDRKPHEIELHKILDHPTQPGTLPTMPSEKITVQETSKLSDTDMGWVD